MECLVGGGHAEDGVQPAREAAAVLIWRKAPVIAIVLAAGATAAGWPHVM